MRKETGKKRDFLLLPKKGRRREREKKKQTLSKKGYKDNENS